MIAPPPLPSTPVLRPLLVHHSGVPVEVIRREHLTHENALKSVAKLHLLAGGVCVLGSAIFVIGFIFSMVGGAPSPVTEPADLVIFALIAVLAVAHLQVGLNLLRLNPTVRRSAIVLACLGLLSVPVGTLVNALVLSYLLSKKGTFVLSEEYRGIVAQTPHVKAKTSLAAVIVLVVLLAILTAILLPFFL